LLIDLKPKTKKSSGMNKNREKQCFKKVVKRSKSSGIRVDRTHPKAVSGETATQKPRDTATNMSRLLLVFPIGEMSNFLVTEAPNRPKHNNCRPYRTDTVRSPYVTAVFVQL
jgi:hypothetical protein